MPISGEMRRLHAKWQTNNGWPKRLDWIEIKGIRGWTGQRFIFPFPIMAVVGENGVGKSTVLQCAASVYRSTSVKSTRYASDFLPDTTWEKIRNAEVSYAVREQNTPHEGSVRKPGARWRGNPDRRERPVQYIDLSRVQPVSARVGYAKLAKSQHSEISASAFDQTRLSRFSQIMGHQYDLAKLALTDADSRRSVPVLGQQSATYSGFHQGAGETTIVELLQADLPRYGLILIDEIETSLHPRSQRRLIRDLADKCRDSELQIVLSTHSPYILDELPLEARAYIMQTQGGGRQIVYGVSPDFAMSKMDDQPHYECDLYMEDDKASRLLLEILAAHAPGLVQRCQSIPYGAASVGQALGQMVAQRRFPRPSCVFLDGDRGPSLGCFNLPGDDAPERVVFEALAKIAWGKTADRTGRLYADFADACAQAMLLNDHHEWVKHAATKLVLSGDILWQAMCAEWATKCLNPEVAKELVGIIENALLGVLPAFPTAPSPPPPIPVSRAASPASPTETLPLFQQFSDVRRR